MNVVLIVEDEELEREFLEVVVSAELQAGDKLLTCGTGLEAIELAKQHKPNIIFMDMM
ncbi:MAG TPA: DNA-binding response regulator, partial [Bacillus bacterium]|nr:DNA-binding response regulator [Bacillus sp. (in: firmicutes)]